MSGVAEIPIWQKFRCDATEKRFHFYHYDLLHSESLVAVSSALLAKSDITMFLVYDCEIVLKIRETTWPQAQKDFGAGNQDIDVGGDHAHEWQAHS